MTTYYRTNSAPVRVTWSRDEEIRLHRRAKRSPEAREEFVKMFLLYAAEVGQRASSGRLKNDEALSAANQGLIRAMRRWNPSGGSRFSTFARKFIRGAVLSEIRKATIRGTRYVSVDDVQFEHHECPSDAPGPKELAESSDLLGTAGGTVLRRVMHYCLNAQERQAVKLRFEEQLNFKQIGERMGFRRQRAQQIVSKALARLKEAYGSKFKRRQRI